MISSLLPEKKKTILILNSTHKKSNIKCYLHFTHTKVYERYPKSVHQNHQGQE